MKHIEKAPQLTGDSVLHFYNKLVDDYHLCFVDWRKSVVWHGEVIDKIIRVEVGEPPQSVLDCSCGIGTQAIGLALRGYRVHATDLSPAAVKRAEREAESFGVHLTFGVADFRKLETQVKGSFDVVISCDNSLPHLLSDEDLLLAVQNIWSKLRTGGLLLASIRDYDQLIEEKPRSTIPYVSDDSGGKRIYFQAWDWSDDGRTCVIHLFLLRETASDWNVMHYSTQYRALLRDDLSEILRKTGFSDIHWQMPNKSSYFQPIVTARKK